jgi:hypothetical protein
VAELFAASGGSGSKAGAKIQLMMDYKSGSVSHLCSLRSPTTSSYGLTDAISPDQNQMHTALDHIGKGELLINHLGYFSQDSLVDIVSAEAFFLGRFQTQTALYTRTEYGEYKRLSLWEILKQTQQPVREIPVYLGAKARLLCRLIIQRLPDGEVEKRKRRLRATAKKKGQTLGQEKLALCAWNLYVTNVDSEVFPAVVVPSVFFYGGKLS